MKDLHLIVCGAREYDNRRMVFLILDRIHKKRGINLILEGGATGVDRLAREWAQARGVLFKTFEAKWDDVDAPGAVVRRRRDVKRYNAAAGPARNAEMLSWPYLSGVVAFPGGKGTADMVRQARKAGVAVWEPLE